MKSSQEEIIKALSEFSIGAPFIFQPDEYSKGNAKREPADLIWACNNAIILLYMKSKESPKESIERSVLINRKDKLIEGNIKQAKGWLDEWKSGRNIIGKNKTSNFDIKYDDYKYKIILSVIDYGEEEGEYHEIFENELNITLCATISQKSLKHIVDFNGSFLDFISMIVHLKQQSLKKYKISNSNFVNRYLQEQVSKIDPENNFSIKGFDFLNKHVHKLLDGVRSTIGSKFVDNNIAGDLPSMLNDIPLHAYLLLKKQITHLCIDIIHDPRVHKLAAVKINNYAFILQLADVQNWHMMTAAATELGQKLEKDGLNIIFLVLDPNPTMTIPSIAYKPRQSKSEVETILERL